MGLPGNAVPEDLPPVGDRTIAPSDRSQAETSIGRKMFAVGFQPTLAISRGFEPTAGHETN
ncbi:MAG: hypothetical protein AB4352_02660 [Hormoscilla sp.]